MFKSLFFLLLRAALGFVLISLIFMPVMNHRVFSAEVYAENSSLIYTWFYLGTLVAWIAGVVLAVGDFAGFSSKKSAAWLAWAPVFLPPVYAGLSLLWLTQITLK